MTHVVQLSSSWSGCGVIVTNSRRRWFPLSYIVYVINSGSNPRACDSLAYCTSEICSHSSLAIDGYYTQYATVLQLDASLLLKTIQEYNKLYSDPADTYTTIVFVY